MDPGALDREVVIEQVATTKDAFGQMIETWSPLATVWARVRQKAGSEIFREGIIGSATTAFVVRWRDDLTVRHRLVYQGHTYDIKHIREMGRNAYLELVATAIPFEGLG